MDEEALTRIVPGQWRRWHATFKEAAAVFVVLDVGNDTTSYTYPLRNDPVVDYACGSNIVLRRSSVMSELEIADAKLGK